MKTLVAVLGLATSSLAFASGSPAVTCRADNYNLTVSVGLARSDEDLVDVLGKTHAEDFFAAVGQGYTVNLEGKKLNPKNPFGRPDEFGSFEMPEGARGAYQRIALNMKQTLQTFIVESSTYKNGDYVFQFRIFASNKPALTGEKMRGLMTLQASRKVFKDLKIDVKREAIEVTCISGWE